MAAKQQPPGTMIALGVAIGTAIGVAMNQIAIGVAVGVAIGAALETAKPPVGQKTALGLKPAPGAIFSPVQQLNA